MPNNAEITVDHDEYTDLKQILEDQLHMVASYHRGFMNTGEVGDVVDQIALSVEAANERLWEPKPFTPLIDLEAVAQNDEEFDQPNVA